MKRLQLTKSLLAVLLLAGTTLLAQSPTGTIDGTVTDPSGAVITAARVTILNTDTGLSRTYITEANGIYGAAALPVGRYEVQAEAKGFSTMMRQVVVEAGSTTTVDLSLHVGEITGQITTVAAASPQIQHDFHQVSGVVTRNQIDSLPLNGRSFFELGKLEPGVQPPSRSGDNWTLVSVLGAPVVGGIPGRFTRVTVDGGSIMAVNQGGAAMGFSQEVVQEFQIATVNLYLYRYHWKRINQHCQPFRDQRLARRGVLLFP
jgi:hypothetical protein